MDRLAEISKAQMAVYRGGKKDDITVVVATVGRAKRKPKRRIEWDPDSACDGVAATSVTDTRAGVDIRRQQR